MIQAEPTVFLVDDDHSVLKSMRWLLESTGYSVETYASAAAFLASFDAAKLGCIILDLKMASMDGTELQQCLNARGSHPPIIFVTGHGDVRHCAQAMKAGAVDFLEKPIQDQLVLGQVQRAVAIDHQRRKVEARWADIEKRLRRLSPREREIMELLVSGRPMKSISGLLGICFQTVARHRAHILNKLNVQGDVELARLIALRPSRRIELASSPARNDRHP